LLLIAAIDLVKFIDMGCLFKSVIGKRKRKRKRKRI